MSLSHKTILGALWHVGTQMGGRVIGLAGTLIITRFLAPAEVGEVGAAFVLVFSAHLVTNAAFGDYVSAHQDVSGQTLFPITVLSLASAAVASALALVLAPFLAGPLGAPGLTAHVPGLALSYALTKAVEVPERLLMRSLRYRRIGLATTGGETFYVVTSLVLAMAGWGGKALVLGNLARALFRVAVIASAVELPMWLSPSRIPAGRILAVLRFGFPLQLAVMCAQAAVKWDNLLISALFGPAATGLYGLAFNLAALPSDNVGTAASDVLFSSLPRLPRERRPAAMVRALGLLALIIFPLGVGLAFVAPTLVAALFPPKWQPLAPIITVLAAFSVVHPIADPLMVYLKTQGRTRVVLLAQAVRLFLVLGAIKLLSVGGLVAASCGQAAGGVFYLLFLLWFLAHTEGLAAGAVLASAGRVLAACGAMGVAVLLARAALAATGAHGAVVALAVEMAAGVLVYVLAAFVVARAQARDLLFTARGAFRRPPAEEATAKPAA
jgi:lipopolysaccharide exporter